ncbi:BMP family protein [Ramlibacter sp.]|uniref:BMP family protein n=1 Tax=Ramlibacter sp. TaxID=1917967 RepID=UPI0018024512|nr:BMP family protein [Ramlibacter sp.]MBA2676403.1 BMP family protein [Ramlibacter sp.]
MKMSKRRFLASAALPGLAAAALPRAFAQAAAPYKIAIALPGSITDNGWSQAAFDALTAAKAKYGIEFAYTEKIKEPDHVETLSDYARRGYKLVIAHGGEFQDAVNRVAARFPNTTFVVNNGLATGKNVATADFYFSQPAFLMGYVAGKMSKTGKAGFIGAQKFKFTTDSLAGFEAGFKRARPDGKVFASWTGDWEDVAKGKEAALNQISQGVDVLWPTMDRATVGALQAAKEKRVYAVGLYYDAIKSWPDIILQSDILDVRGMMLNYIKVALDKGLEGRNYKYDLNTPEAVRIGSFHPAVPPAVAQEVEALVADMKAGKLKPQPL